MMEQLQPLDLRPAVAEDDVRIVEIYNLHEADSLPLTVARYRMETAIDRAGDQPACYVAMHEDRLVGFGSFHWAWWTGDPGVYSGNVCVDPVHLRQGIGTQLFDLIRSQLRQRGVTRLLTWLPANPTDGQRFAARMGAYETGQVIQEYHLRVSEADTDADPAVEMRLAHEGLRIVPLSELAREDRAFLRALQRLWANSGETPPDPDQLDSSFESWRQQVLDASGMSPETHWIALEGERPVGMTFLKRLSDDAFENDYTCVAPTHRGRGIATALKRHAIIWAQHQEVTWFCTSSEIGNDAMIAVNTRLGYRPTGRRLEVACELS
jgi:GNAT superfamily N-acetyltransferase